MADMNQGPDMKSREAEMAQQDKEIRQRLGRVKNKILVMSGKGGVGKSTIARKVFEKIKKSTDPAKTGS